MHDAVTGLAKQTVRREEKRRCRVLPAGLLLIWKPASILSERAPERFLCLSRPKTDIAYTYVKSESETRKGEHVEGSLQLLFQTQPSCCRSYKRFSPDHIHHNGFFAPRSHRRSRRSEPNSFLHTTPLAPHRVSTSHSVIGLASAQFELREQFVYLCMCAVGS
jgi:hypothetical protein